MWDWVSKLQELKNAGIGCVVVTLTEHSGSSPREPGAKMIVLSAPNDQTAQGCGTVFNGSAFYGSVGGGHLEQLALEEAAKILNTNGSSRKIKYPLGAKTGQCCGGIVELFFEVIQAGPVLYLFGVGHVGQALVRTLQDTPFKVHAIDSRTEWIHHKELPQTVIRHECEWDEFIRKAMWSDRNTFVAVMTCDHQMDQAIIEAVVKHKIRYAGLIGSKSKWERFKQRFTHRGLDPSLFEKVHCPIGLKIGGKSPQEIAISVAGELLKEYYE